MIIGVAEAVVGKVVRVRPHPRGDFIWLADVDLGAGAPPMQIVFGGKRIVRTGDLVPVAPPGVKATVWDSKSAMIAIKTMRARNYRGQRSHGMLCSLDELGWLKNGPDEVPALKNLPVGRTLDHLLDEDWPDVVVNWQAAKAFADRRAHSPAPPVLEGSKIA
jgi:tRNA-binding EMAP/Myf-like protein